MIAIANSTKKSQLPRQFTVTENIETGVIEGPSSFSDGQLREFLLGIPEIVDFTTRTRYTKVSFKQSKITDSHPGEYVRQAVYRKEPYISP